MTTASAMKTESPVTSLCDNTLAHVTLFLDIKSSTTLSKLVSKGLTNRMGDETTVFEQHVWKKTFDRHGFLAAETESWPKRNHRAQTLRRLGWFRTLVGKSPNPSTFSLPHRCFHFLPIHPPDELVLGDDDDFIPPPVAFDCPSFLLTSPSSSELLFLHPFHGSLVVYDDILDHCVKSPYVFTGQDVDPRMHQNLQLKEPSTVLLDMRRYFDIDLSEYFVIPDQDLRYAARPSRSSRHHLSDPPIVLHEDQEVEIDFIGIDCKPVAGVGMSFIVARELNVLATSAEMPFEDHFPRTLTEVQVWIRPSSGKGDIHKSVCRVPHDYHCLEVNPGHKRLYMNFPKGEGPSFVRRYEASLDNQVDDDGDHTALTTGTRTIVAYPLMLAASGEKKGSIGPRYFPRPDFMVRAAYPVATMVGAGSSLLVGTSQRTIEVWSVRDGRPTRETTLDIRDELSLANERTRGRRKTAGLKRSVQTTLNIPEQARRAGHVEENRIDELDDAGSWAEGDCELEHVGSDSLSLEEENSSTNSLSRGDAQAAGPSAAYARNEYDAVDHTRENPVVPIGHVQPVLHPHRHLYRTYNNESPRYSNAPIQSIHVSVQAGSDAIERFGFVSLQHAVNAGSALVVWTRSGSDDKFAPIARIDLPLLAQRKPRIHYDGRRLIVFGIDHIGWIVLVYHVMVSNEDLAWFDATLHPDSGGVRCFGGQPRVRFANRIRHVALGESSSSWYDETFLRMTCNERFLVLNTRAGNLLAGGQLTDGLLVIDLHQR